LEKSGKQSQKAVVMSFQGEFINTIDPKGRASIPVKFREVLASVYGGESLFVTKRNGGLIAYPPSEWRTIEDNVRQLPPGQMRDDTYRVLINPAQECGFDKQGRIQLPQSLRVYAALDRERDMVVVGIINKIEIWSQVRHEEMTRTSEMRLNDNAQALAGLGF
jgi:MraZ protein